MNFNDISKMKVSEIERSPLIPVGTYEAVVSKIPSVGSIANGAFEALDFNMKLVRAHDDVDKDDLKAYGGLGPMASVRRRFLFNTGDAPEDKANFERTLFQVKTFLKDHLKVEGDSDAALNEMMNNAVNHRCNVFIRWRADKNDKEIMYAEIGSTGPIV